MYLLSIIFLLLHFISALSPDPRLWGVDSWSYLPGVFSYLFLVAGLLPLVPKINDGIRSIFDKISDAVVKIPFLILTLIFGVLLYTFSEEAFLSGDGLLRIRNMTAGSYIIAAEPLETFLHQIIYDLVNSIISVSSESVYRFISILTGMLTFYLSAGYIKDLFSDQKHRNFMAMMLLTSGAVMLFFGYVETYSINAGVLIIYFLSTSKMLVNRKFSYIPMITISFAVFLHTSSFVFLPTAMFAYYSLRKETEFSSTGIIRLISIFIAFALFTIFAVYISNYPFTKLLSDLTSESHILPLFGNDQTYGIFSPAHLIDLINLLFLTAPIVIALPVILIKLPGVGFTSELKFLGISSLLALFFIIIIKSDLGMARDWDLFALAAYPITIFSVTALIKIYDKSVYRVALPLFVICLVHTAPWILLNSSGNLAVERAERLAESSHWTGHSKAILFDAVANEHYKNNQPGKALELSIKAYNNERDDRFLFNIANGYSNI
ncbi:MAG: hypothetical protein KAH48_08765, partial [Chlorobi bacterium]|nr:hypothetical protein [Chlorobiota bacterium]